MSLDGERRRRPSGPDPEMLGVVEGMARRLLSEDEVASVMKTCRRVWGLGRRGTENMNCYHPYSMDFCMLCVIVTIFLQYITERVVENLVRHLLAVLDRPEKLLLLREIRYTERQQ